MSCGHIGGITYLSGRLILEVSYKGRSSQCGTKIPLESIILRIINDEKTCKSSLNRYAPDVLFGY